LSVRTSSACQPASRRYRGKHYSEGGEKKEERIERAVRVGLHATSAGHGKTSRNLSNVQSSRETKRARSFSRFGNKIENELNTSQGI